MTRSLYPKNHVPWQRIAWYESPDWLVSTVHLGDKVGVSKPYETFVSPKLTEYATTEEDYIYTFKTKLQAEVFHKIVLFFVLPESELVDEQKYLRKVLLTAYPFWAWIDRCYRLIQQKIDTTL